uniref:Immunoglobulin V-set domain-containing protein n=1 Tax=Malurus cyaneus samueli TaxID=2593467 RepID=A0A8C5U9P7_9PASS
MDLCSTIDATHWYRQFPGQPPQLITMAVRGTKPVLDPVGSLWVSEDRKSSALYLARPRRGDAAVYYCALVTRAQEPRLRPGTNQAVPCPCFLWGRHFSPALPQGRSGARVPGKTQPGCVPTGSAEPRGLLCHSCPFSVLTNTCPEGKFRSPHVRTKRGCGRTEYGSTGPANLEFPVTHPGPAASAVQRPDPPHRDRLPSVPCWDSARS